MALRLDDSAAVVFRDPGATVTLEDGDKAYAWSGSAARFRHALYGYVWNVTHQDGADLIQNGTVTDAEITLDTVGKGEITLGLAVPVLNNFYTDLQTLASAGGSQVMPLASGVYQLPPVQTVSISKDVEITIRADGPLTLLPAPGQRHLDFEIRNDTSFSLAFDQVTLDGQGSGGGISIGTILPADVTVALKGAVIQHCKRTGTGGAVEVGSATLQITDCRFIDNEANLYGGGVQAGGNVTVSNSYFVDNRTTYNSGGGIRGSNITLNGSNTFLDNTAGDGNGGSVSASGSLTVQLEEDEVLLAQTASDSSLYATGDIILEGAPAFLWVQGGTVALDAQDYDVDGLEVAYNHLALHTRASEFTAVGTPRLELDDSLLTIEGLATGEGVYSDVILPDKDGNTHTLGATSGETSSLTYDLNNIFTTPGTHAFDVYQLVQVADADRGIASLDSYQSDLASGSVTISGRTLFVDGAGTEPLHYTDLQAAADDAVDGDTIVLLTDTAGMATVTYFGTHGLTIRSGPDGPYTIDGLLLFLNPYPVSLTLDSVNIHTPETQMIIDNLQSLTVQGSCDMSGQSLISQNNALDLTLAPGAALHLETANQGVFASNLTVTLGADTALSVRAGGYGMAVLPGDLTLNLSEGSRAEIYGSQNAVYCPGSFKVNTTGTPSLTLGSSDGENQVESPPIRVDGDIALTLENLSIASDADYIPAVALYGSDDSSLTILGDCALETTGESSEGIRTHHTDILLVEGAALSVATTGDAGDGILMDLGTHKMTLEAGASLEINTEGLYSYGLYLHGDEPALLLRQGAAMQIETSGRYGDGIFAINNHPRITLEEKALFDIATSGSGSSGIFAENAALELFLAEGAVLLAEGIKHGILADNNLTLSGTPAFVYVEGTAGALSGPLRTDGLEGTIHDDGTDLFVVVASPGLALSPLTVTPVTVETDAVLLDVGGLFSLEKFSIPVTYALLYNTDGTGNSLTGLPVDAATTQVNVAQLLTQKADYTFSLVQTLSYGGTDWQSASSPVGIHVSWAPLTAAVTPSSASMTTGGSASFTAKASGGDGIYAYVWEESADNGVNWTVLTESSDTLTVTKSAAGSYQFRVTITDGTATEAAATADLNVTRSASSGGSGGRSNYAVTFNSNGGSSVSTQRISHSGTVTEPKNPTREGYAFTGWYTDAELTTKYDFTTKVTKAFTLYAGWEEATSDEPEEFSHPAYITGYADGTFRPEVSLTRAEAASLLYKLIDSGITAESYVQDFSDVAGDAWYYDGVMELARRGILSGYKDGSFKPDNTISRAEFVAMALRFAGLDGLAEASGFSDVLETHWAATMVARAVAADFVSGYPDGTFRPEESVSRAEAVSILNRVIGCEGMTGSSSFTDVPGTHWAFEAIMSAATGHDH